MTQKIYNIFVRFSLPLLLLCTSCNSENNSTTEVSPRLSYSNKIPVKGNSWVIGNLAKNRVIHDEGILNWTDQKDIIRTYFKVYEIGEVNVGLVIKSPGGNSKIKVSLGNQSKEVIVNNRSYESIDVGTFNLSTKGYHFIDLQGVTKSSAIFAYVSDILIGDYATSEKLSYVEEDYYFGRRGPTVHLAYKSPTNIDIEWSYSEIKIPEGSDVLGSFFMANGFKGGYFGIQVNSEREKRILFSVWSSYDAQNTGQVPTDYKVLRLNKGPGVVIKEFENEGTGGQSYKVFDWKVGNTYKFLVKGEPTISNSTDYTAYFYAPEVGEWQLIASFRRPYTTTYLTNFHSFLENFKTETGFITRSGLYQNQWVRDRKGKWYEMTSAFLTADETARKGDRKDFEGGVKAGSFYLKNCGFFDSGTTLDTYITRKASDTPPEIDFSRLENN